MDAVERVVDVGERVLEAERDQHDPGDHRIVQVRVRVARERVALGPRRAPARGAARSRARRRRSRSTRSRRRARLPRTAAAIDAGVEVDVGADPERDDRLAEREDDDQVVALGEMAGHEPPARRGRTGPARPSRTRSRAATARPARAPSKNDAPTSSPTPIAVLIARSTHRAPQRRGRRGSRARTARCGRRVRRRRTRANASARVVERLRDAQRHDEQRRHRREDRDPDRALLGIDDAGEPRVARPRPTTAPRARACPGRPPPRSGSRDISAVHCVNPSTKTRSK